MKIRYYKKIDGWRWLGFVLAMVGAWVLSNANPDTQWQYQVVVFGFTWVGKIKIYLER
jgi:hypothetical protein